MTMQKKSKIRFNSILFIQAEIAWGNGKALMRQW